MTGHFTPQHPQVELLDQKRNIRLTNDFDYTASDGTSWPVPKGVVADGASIPQAFWSIIGGPLDGEYRDASIIHDYYCDMRTRTWQATHRMFYDAMLTSGVDTIKAKVMFYAVWWGGPRWEQRVSINTNLKDYSIAIDPTHRGHIVSVGVPGDVLTSLKGISGSSDALPVTVETVPIAQPATTVPKEEQRDIAKAIEAKFAADAPDLDEIEALAEKTRPVGV